MVPIFFITILRYVFNLLKYVNVRSIVQLETCNLDISRCLDFSSTSDLCVFVIK